MSPFSLAALRFLLSRWNTEADIGIVLFHITGREFIHFHILKIRTFFRGTCFLTLSIYQRLPNFSSSIKTQFRKNISYTYCQLCRNTTKPTKWPVRPAKTQIRLGIRTEPLCSWLSNERTAKEADAQADLSLRWAYMLVGFVRLWLIYMHHMCADRSVWGVG